MIVAARKQLIENRVYDGLVRTHSGHLDIKVSKENIYRALKIMDTFIKMTYHRGHYIISEFGESFIIIVEEKQRIGLKEKTKRVPPTESWRSFDQVPTGILNFIAQIHYQRVEWKDGKVRIEDQLARILAKLELVAMERRSWKVEAEMKRKEKEKQEQIAKNLALKKEVELGEFRKLIQAANRWNQTTILRDFIGELEKKANLDGHILAGRNQWLEWARKKIDWYDPFLEEEDELLKGFDRNNI